MSDTRYVAGEQRYVFDDGGVWSQSPDDPPVQANPACVHDKVTGDEFDCTNESRLPELAAILNSATSIKKKDAWIAKAAGMLGVLGLTLEKAGMTNTAESIHQLLTEGNGLIDADA